MQSLPPIDNNIPDKQKKLTKEQYKFQLLQAVMHRRNIEERVIQTFYVNHASGLELSNSS